MSLMSRIVKKLRGAILMAAWAVVAGGAGGCVSNSGLLVVLQNQQPVIDETTRKCVAGSTASASPVGSGVLDLEVGADPVYLVYPLVQSTLPARATMPGAVEPNSVTLDGVRGTLVPPPGFDMTWPAGCPANFFSATAGQLLPGTTIGLTAQVINLCQARAIHDQFVAGALPPDLGQQVIFTIEMRVVGRVASGDEITSDAFRFAVRACIGCLQTNFPDIAQFDFPNRPSCSAAPKPNIYHGNPCNFAQDYGPLLCCTGDMNQAVCPAPDM